MKKRIIAGFCAGAMSVAGCLSFAGCEEEHKHTFEDSYELATCTDMGFTLHSCTECDYMYADEFVMPYGHAYEYCLNFAVPAGDTQPAAYSVERTTVARAANINVGGMSLSVLGEGPMCEVTQAQRGLVEDYISKQLNSRYEQSVPSDSAKTIVFEFSRCPFCDEHGESAYTLSVPILSTVPIPQFDVGNAILETTLELAPVGGGSGAFDGDSHDHGVEPRTLPPAKEEHNPATVAAVPTKYALSDNGELTYGTKAAATDLCKGGENTQPVQLTMADTVVEIEANAFGDCSELKRVELSSSLTKIGANAFGAAKLDFLVMPVGLKTIGANAFGDCKNMKYLFYYGVQADFDGIAFEDANDAIKFVPRYFYSEEKPNTDGNFWHFVDGEPTVW